jgi:putative iron-dependent peroxidase
MPQKGIFKGTEISNSALFLEYKIDADVNVTLLKINLQKLKNLENTTINVVLAFSKKTYAILNSEHPEGLKDFETLKGVNNLTMPSTQSDLLIWCYSEAKGDIFDFSFQANLLLDNLIELKTKEEGFKYHDSRDLMGFVDGSANPLDEERKDVALLKNNSAHSKGSFVFTQKWVHDLKSFNNNSEKTQEQIIGRTKKESIELEGDAMPLNSHVSRTDVKVKGETMKIFRRSYPFTNGKEHGLFFLGFAKSIDRFDIQLRRMIGDTEDKVSDRIMEFSDAKTGSYYFAPSENELNALLTE